MINRIDSEPHPSGWESATYEYYFQPDVTFTIARTTLVQTFSNKSDVLIDEAKYIFPLYNGAAVVSYKCTIGKTKVLVGVVKPNEEAKAEYHTAKSRHQVATLLEQHTPEVFETHLGNIPGNTQVKIEIIYIYELKPSIRGKGLLVTIPTSIAPRYGKAPIEYHGDRQYIKRGLKITVNVTATSQIEKLESLTHPISMELGTRSLSQASTFAALTGNESVPAYDPKRARATLTNRSASLGKDFVLIIHFSDHTALASRAILEKSSIDKRFAPMMITLSPWDLFPYTESTESFTGEIIFIADRSGSMNGEKIDTLGNAMKIFLKSLPVHCLFNVYSFGSSFTSLWPHSQPYAQQSLDVAIRHVANDFKADMGGTELLGAIKHAFENRSIKDKRSVQIITLTDGEVWNEDEAINFIRQARVASEEIVRFFALGIGEAVSHHLVEGIGVQGGGFAEVVDPNQVGNWHDRVIHMLKASVMPADWNIEIELPELKKSTEDLVTPLDEVIVSPSSTIQRGPAIQAPFQIPSLHTFTRFSVYITFDCSQVFPPERVIIRGISQKDQQITSTLGVEGLENDPPVIRLLAARAEIRDLESGTSWIHQSSVKPKLPIDSFEKTEAERMGLQWGITSKYTSFVAVESGTTTANIATIYQPKKSELADLMSPRRQEALEYPRFPSTGATYKFLELEDLDFAVEFMTCALSDSDDAWDGCTTNLKQIISLLGIIDYQKFDGSFMPLEPTMINILMERFEDGTLGSLYSQIEKTEISHRSLLTQKDDLENLLTSIAHTIISIVYIELAFSQEKDTWQLVVSKARDYINAQVEDTSIVDGIYKFLKDQWKQKENQKSET